MKNIFDKISLREQAKLLNFLNAHEGKFEKNKDISIAVKGRDSICVVLSGLVEIIKNDKQGNRIIIEEIEENEIFGSNISNINNNEYSVVTREDTTLIIIDTHSIIFKEHNKAYYNQFLKNLMEIYEQKIKEKNKRIDILTKKSIRDKLLEYFNSLNKANTSKIIYLPFSYTDLSDYLGVNRSALSREISSLKDEGLIETQGRKIKLLYYNVE